MRTIRGRTGNGLGNGFKQVFYKYFGEDQASKNESHNVYEQYSLREELI